MKKIKLFLLLVLSLVLIPFGVKADSTYGKIAYYIDSNKEIHISDVLDSASGEVVIPAKINGYKVKTVDIGAFRYNSKVTKVVFKGNVETIERYAFMDMENLTEVVLPSSLKKIDTYAFAECPKLAKINLPTKLERIGSAAFYNDASITSITLPDSLVDIGLADSNGAFEKTSITSIKLPKGLKTLGDRTFASTKLKSLVVPSGLDYLGDSLCEDCKELTTVTINSRGTTPYMFSGATSLKTIKFNKNFTSIGSGSFKGVTSLTYFNVPRNVTEIGSFAFKEAVNLKKIVIPRTVTKIYYGPFDGIDGLTLYVEKGSDAEIFAINEGLKYSIYRPMEDVTVSSISDKAYTGKAITPTVTVKYKSTKLVKDKDYTVSYKNNKAVGTATVTITGKGKYIGTITKTFKIAIGRPKSFTASTKTKTSITLKWGKSNGSITGYEIYRKNLKTGKYELVKTVSSKKTSFKDTNLKSGKNYSYRIRSYKKLDSGTKYSKYVYYSVKTK